MAEAGSTGLGLDSLNNSSGSGAQGLSLVAGPGVISAGDGSPESGSPVKKVVRF